MNVTQAVKFANISATTAGFTVLGGKYQLSVVATFGGGNVGVDVLAGDGTTWVPCVMLTSDGASVENIQANGTAILDLPPGQYRISVSTATAVYATLARVPY